MMRWVGRIAAVIFLVLASGFFFLVAADHKQTRSTGALRSLQADLANFRQRTGTFPASLAELPAGATLDDAWDHPIRYHRVADGYVIASLGRDGEGPEYDWAKIHSLVAKERRVLLGPFRGSDCRHLDVDLIATDAGWYRSCAK